MVDVVNKATRSRMMAGIRARDTKPEVFLRTRLHRMGFRYRLGGAGLPGKPDLVFTSRRTVVFVHGCFWHMHDCKYFKWPAQNAKFWRRKIEGNAARDKSVLQSLRTLGWQPLIVWECQLRETRYTTPNRMVSRVAQMIGATTNRKKSRQPGNVRNPGGRRVAGRD